MWTKILGVALLTCPSAPGPLTSERGSSTDGSSCRPRSLQDTTLRQSTPGWPLVAGAPPHTSVLAYGRMSHVLALLDLPLQLLSRGLTQHLLQVDVVHLAHGSQVVHPEAHLGRTDEGSSCRVSESGDSTLQRGGVWTGVKLWAEPEAADHLQVKYWTPSWLPSCLPLSGWSHSTPSHRPQHTQTSAQCERRRTGSSRCFRFLTWCRWHPAHIPHRGPVPPT